MFFPFKKIPTATYEKTEPERLQRRVELTQPSMEQDIRVASGSLYVISYRGQQGSFREDSALAKGPKEI